jgi:hypothetical protein
MQGIHPERRRKKLAGLRHDTRGVEDSTLLFRFQTSKDKDMEMVCRVWEKDSDRRAGEKVKER